MSCFDLAIQILLQEEGGFVNDPQDNGGATKYGISLRWLKSLDQVPEALNFVGEITVKTIQQLTRDQAIVLYRHYFWEPYRYECIINQLVANKVFSFAVNAGSHVSHTVLQWALHATGRQDMIVDGILGEHTIQAVNTVDYRLLLAALRSEIAGHYRLLKNPHFEAGWLKRAYA
jgi:lysozyme family protein